MFKVLIIDFDNMYNQEKDSEVGIAPSLYLIPEDKEQEVEQTCSEAYDDFMRQDKSDMTILDIFEALLTSKGIRFQHVGNLDSLTFGERQACYINLNMSVISADGSAIMVKED